MQTPQNVTNVKLRREMVMKNLETVMEKSWNNKSVGTLPTMTQPFTCIPGISR